MFENLTWETVSTCVTGQWTPKIGDPNVTGWLTVVAYAVCVLLALWVLAKSARPGRERVFWVFMAVLMLFLAVNKQLDLQSALTAVGRCMSKIQGWYGERRLFQRHFIEGLLAGAAFVFLFCLYLMRAHLLRNGVAIVGLIVVAAFVAVRAVGFHHFDALINTKYMDVRFNFIFEVSGLVLITLNALGLLLATPRRP